MDLSLQGSQINLAERCIKQKNSNQIYIRPHSAVGGNFSRSSTSSSPLLQNSGQFTGNNCNRQRFLRPMSADEKLARNFQNYAKLLNANKKQNKKFPNKCYENNLSSSQEILKLLLEEPIKRSWFYQKNSNLNKNNENLKNYLQKSCRKKGNFRKVITTKETDLDYQGFDENFKSSSEEQEEKGTPQIPEEIKNTKRFLASENHIQYYQHQHNYNTPLEKSLDTNFEVMSNDNENSTISKLTTTQQASDSSNFWNPEKPDLPGRVSFGSTTHTYEVDYSDGENSNNNQQNDEFIINQSPPPTISSPIVTLSSSMMATNKKTVHFDEQTEIASLPLSASSTSKSHQYSCSMCSIEHCPCICNTSSRKIRSADSIQRCCADNKCSCKFGTCTASELKKFSEELNETCKKSNENVRDENQTISNYKKQIEDEDKKLQLEMKMMKKDKPEEKIIVVVPKEETKTSNMTENKFQNLMTSNNLTTLETKNKLTSLGATFENSKYETDYTQVENSSKLHSPFRQDQTFGSNNDCLMSLPKSNLKQHQEEYQLHSRSVPNNEINHRLKTSASSTSFNSSQNLNPIINNYLKVTSTSSVVSSSTKKLNTTPSNSGKRTTNNGYKKSATVPSTSSTSICKKNLRSKSVSPAITKKVSLEDTLRKSKNIKKSETFSSLRQNSNLDEFNLDNIDTWMSIQFNENMNHNFTESDFFRNPSKHHHHHHQQQPHHHHNHENASQHSSKHCHYLKSSEKYESHEDTDTPDQCSKTTEELSSTTSQDSCSGSGSSGSSSSTYDEIVSVIKEIEADKKKDIPQDVCETDLDIKFRNLLHSDLSDISTTSRKDEHETPDKLKDILNYLEDVENSCERALIETRRSIPETSRSEVEFAVEPDIGENVPKISDLIMIPNHQLARRVVALTLRANELSNAIQLSKEHLAHIRQEKQKLIRIERQNASNRIREQKKHYENMLARHQGFIEQLLKDKGSLCEKVTALTRRIESQNQAWEHKLETEVQRAKELATAGEKIRKERWVRENTKKIKELTVKGLEAEIERMNANHQKEISELKKSHQEELQKALDEARQKHEQIEKQIRESCAKDREIIIEKERKAIRERFEKQLQEERKSFDEQRAKLLEDFASERERLFKEIKIKEEELEKRKQEFHHDKDVAVEQVIAECNAKLEQQEQKHQAKINAIEKQFESDFLIWKKEFENACKLREVENENGIRQHYRAERDRQIDAIVSRMDAESLKLHEEFELKLNRLKEKYEADLREAENVEKSLRERFNETRTKLAESDAEVQNLQAEIKQMQIELEHSKKMCDEFLAEKELMKENARNEVQTEISAIKAERDVEIQKIHKRVQQAIEKKDAAMEMLQKDNATLRERCIKLEAIIRQQRKDYCIK